MDSNEKFVVYIKDEPVMHSIYKTCMSGAVLSFCVYISQDSKLWTFVSGLMFLVFVSAKAQALLKMKKTFKSKKELKVWVEGLEND